MKSGDGKAIDKVVFTERGCVEDQPQHPGTARVLRLVPSTLTQPRSGLDFVNGLAGDGASQMLGKLTDGVRVLKRLCANQVPGLEAFSRSSRFEAQWSIC